MLSRQILRTSAGPCFRASFARRLQSTAASQKPASTGFSLKGNPWVPYILLLSMISSAVLKVMAVQQEMRVLEERTAARRSVLEDVLARLDAHARDVASGKIAPGSLGFDVAKEIERLVEKKDLDKTLEEILSEMATAEDEWIETAPAQVATSPQESVEPLEATVPEPVQPVIPQASLPASKPSTSKFL